MLVVAAVWVAPSFAEPHAAGTGAWTSPGMSAGASFAGRIRELPFPFTQPVSEATRRSAILAAWRGTSAVHALRTSMDGFSVAAAGTGETNSAQGLGMAALPGDEATPRVAVAEFNDRSGARLVNVGAGVADKLADRLAAGGARVVSRGEIEAFLQSQGLDPGSLDDLSRAARQLGVNLVVTGTVEEVVVTTSTLDLGLIHVTRSDAHAEATVSLLDVGMDEVAVQASASGDGKGPTQLSLYLGGLLSPSPSSDSCAGGLRSEREVYAEGELVSFGYANSSTSGWFGLEVCASDGTFLRWLGWRFVPRDGCKTWFWDQRDALGVPAGAGLYVARLRDGSSEGDGVTFQIRPGLVIDLPSLDLLTVGTEAFDDDVVGAAMDDMVAQLAAFLLPSILSPRSSPAGALRAAEEAVETSDVRSLLGQIASVLPDGRVAISVGASHGVAAGDRFEVLAADRLAFDPTTQSIVAYDVSATKGHIRIVEVRERASDGICESEFEPLVGDLVRLVP